MDMMHRERGALSQAFGSRKFCARMVGAGVGEGERVSARIVKCSAQRWKRKS